MGSLQNKGGWSYYLFSTLNGVSWSNLTSIFFRLIDKVIVIMIIYFLSTSRVHPRFEGAGSNVDLWSRYLGTLGFQAGSIHLVLDQGFWDPLVTHDPALAPTMVTPFVGGAPGKWEDLRPPAMWGSQGWGDMVILLDASETVSPVLLVAQFVNLWPGVIYFEKINATFKLGCNVNLKKIPRRQVKVLSLKMWWFWAS